VIQAEHIGRRQVPSIASQKALNPYGKIVIRDLHTGAQFDPQKP